MLQIENKPLFINQMFTRIAKKYDFLNNIMTFNLHQIWKKQAIESASVNIPYLKHAKVLDLCTGTGDMAQMWAKKPQVSKVMAIDSCPPMLEEAEKRQRKIKEPWATKITFMPGDALELPFPDDNFDAISVGFGLRNVADLSRAIQEIFRVLKPGGFIVSLDLGHPEQPFIQNIYKNIFLNFIPLLGSIFAGDKLAYRYLVDSLETWPKQKELSQMFWHQGFTRSYFKDLMFGTIALVVAQK
ncbi:MAG: bifunctional demethylmenaquinone methyltransferase/2-methoxy-6-polyprenyl-1,4-benzoquinol methylase UbiE [Candidatus Melainabacteria bacterium]|nr:bifunctional demethylmenaquinone methyltransferase/2-methoxy-6-polyprenyl-1,4-benzoquinol methylase UbiE [Candidatus Melainabacteria bacterium]